MPKRSDVLAVAAAASSSPVSPSVEVNSDILLRLFLMEDVTPPPLLNSVNVSGACLLLFLLLLLLPLFCDLLLLLLAEPFD